jgi:hypothetical protein
MLSARACFGGASGQAQAGHHGVYRPCAHEVRNLSEITQLSGSSATAALSRLPGQGSIDARASNQLVDRRAPEARHQLSPLRLHPEEYEESAMGGGEELPQLNREAGQAVREKERA